MESAVTDDASNSNPTNPAARRRRLRLRSKMLIYFGLVFAATVATLTWLELYGIPLTAFEGGYEQQRSEAFKSLSLVADLKKERLLRWLEERRDDALVLSDSSIMASYVTRLGALVEEHSTRGLSGDELWARVQEDESHRALTEHLELVRTTYGVYDKIEIAHARTGVIMVATEGSELGADVSRRPYFVRDLTAGVGYMDIEPPVAGQGRHLHIARAIRAAGSVKGEQQGAAGVLIMQVSPDDIIKPMLHTGEGLGDTGEALLVDEDARILTSLKHPLPGGSKAEPMGYQIRAESAALASRGEEGVTATEDYRREPVLAAYRHIRVSPTLAWGMVVKRDQAEVFAPLRRSVTYSYVIGALTILLMLGFTVAIAGGLSRPIAVLSRAAERVAAGDLDARAPVTGSQEEVRLAATFNSMVERIQGWRQELEQTVRARTAELAARNDQLAAEVAERRRTEEALRQSEERFRALAESSLDGILAYDTDIRYTVWNPGMERIWGIQREQVLGRSPFEVFPFLDEVGEGAASRNAVKGRPTMRSEMPYRVPETGKSGYFESSHFPLRDAEGNIIGGMAIIRDVTERKQARDALWEAEQKYRLISENATDMIALHRMDDLAYLYANPATLRTLGYPEEELIGKSAADLVHPDDRDRVRSALDRAVASGSGSAEFRCRKKDGTYLWLEATGKVTTDGEQAPLVLVISRDVTERKQAEEALRGSEERYRALVEDMPALICRFRPDGTLTFVNDAYCRYFGKERGQLVGENFFQFIPEEDRPPVKAHYSSLTEDSTVVTYEHPVVAPDGSMRYQRWTDRLLCDEHDRPAELQSIGIDITDRKQAEEALRTSHSLLEIANRHTAVAPLLRECVAEVRRFTGCAAVGMRMLDEEGNIPYQAYEGFPREFYESENPLSINYHRCMCINVIKGAVDLQESFYTKGGSFYLNGTTRFLAALSEQERARTRNVCNAFGYESVALVPIRLGGRILGLIHVADPQENVLPLEKVQLLEKAAMALGPAIVRLQAEEALRDALAEVRQGHAEVSALLDAARAVLESREFAPAARSIFDTCKELTGATAGYVALLTPDGTGNEVLFLDAGGLPCSVDPSLPMPIRGLRGEAYRTGKPTYDNEFATSEWTKYLPEGHVTLQNALFAPLVIEGKTVGLIGLANKPGGFTDNDARMTAAFGEIASVALLNSRTLEALRESEENFRRTFDQSPIGAAIVSLDQRFVRVNAELCSITMYSAEELTSLEFAAITHPDDREADAEQVQRLQAGETDQYQLDKRCIRKDGRVVWIRLSVRLLREAGGRPLYFLPMMEDITQRMRMERALRKTRDRLEQRVQERTAELTGANQALLAQIAERKRIEQELLSYQRQLRFLASERLLAEERERRRIAADLHDRIGQTLAVSKIKLGQLLKSASAGDLIQSLSEVRELIDQTVRDTRSLTFDLSPPVLYELGLEAAIEWFGEQLQEQYGIEIVLEDGKEPLRLSDDTGGILFRAVRELLLNVVKHAGAHRARVAVRAAGDEVRITVEDDGVGFDVAEAQARGHETVAFGLFNIRELLDHLGGRLDIESEPGKGTCAILVAPMGRH